MQERVVGVDRTSLAHGHLVGGIETGCSDIPDGTGLVGLAVEGVLSSEGVAVVLDEPEVVLVAELLDLGEVEGVAEGVRHEDELGLVAQGSLHLGDVDVAGAGLDIHEDGHRSVLEDGCHAGGEGRRDADDLIAALDLPVSQKRGGQGHECDEIRGRSGVDRGDELNAEIFGKVLLELIDIFAGGEPEVQSRIDDVD